LLYDFLIAFKLAHNGRRYKIVGDFGGKHLSTDGTL
jgi:hypothetical protein